MSGAPSLWHLARAAPRDTGPRSAAGIDSMLMGPGPSVRNPGHIPRRWKLKEVYRETNDLAGFSDVLSACSQERLSPPADGDCQADAGAAETTWVQAGDAGRAWAGQRGCSQATRV